MTKRKLLILRPTMGQGGADRVTLNLLVSLRDTNFDVELFLMKKTGELLSEIPSFVTVSSPKSRNLIAFFFPLLAKIKHHQPDVIFATDGGVALPASMAHFFLLSKSRLIISERGRIIRANKWLNRILRLPLKAVFFRRADKIIAVSDAVAKDISQLLLIPGNRIALLHNPVIPENYEVLSASSLNHKWIDQGAKIIVHAGRFVQEKDHQTLIEAFAKVREQMNVKLILLGDGPLRDSIVQLVNQLGLQDDVDIVGFQKNVYPYFKLASVFVLSSISEGMPGVLIQAMSLGTPCVSTDCPTGPREILGYDERFGLLVRMRDVTQMASAILRILHDEEWAKQMGKRGRDRVRPFHAKEAMSKYIDLLSS